METIEQPPQPPPTPDLEADDHERRKNLKRTLWGGYLMLLGTAFLLDRLDVTDFSWGHLWPVVFFVIAGTRLVERRPGGAVSFVLLGLWFFACNEGWYGLDYRNSWSLLLIVVGLGIVIRALTREDTRRRRRLGGTS